MRAALLDLDGTVLRGGDLLEGADEGVRALRAAGLEVVFLTNNPTRSPGALADALSDHGVPADTDDVLTSAAATRAYLDANHAGERALPVAGDAVVAQLRDADVRFVEDPATAEVVVAGYDESFDYAAMTDGLRALRSGAALVGTDPDRWVPTGDGPIPGSGAVVNAIAGAAETEPDAVLGKPSAETVDIALERVGVAPGECLLVGDRLDTDVAMGERAGMSTALVLTGASDRAALDATDRTPDHVLPSLADVHSLL
jgi:4-nitrophenyl phosphatase